MDHLYATGTVLAVVAGALGAAWAGRWAARALRQPEIVGEIACCLLFGALLARGGVWTVPDAPGRAIGDTVGHMALALFLVATARELRNGTGRLSGRAVGLLALGSAVLPVIAGIGLAVWVLTTAGPALRGGAPTPSLVLMLAVSLAVTAVPVLAGILRDRRLAHTDTGRLALAAAVLIDAVTWVLLAVAVGLATGSDGWSRLLLLPVAGVAATWLLRRLLSVRQVRDAGAAHPWVTTVATGAAAIAAAFTTRELGLTDVFGAVLVGLALPATGKDTGWEVAVGRLHDIGRGLLPVLFAVTGTALAGGPEVVLSWPAVLLATGLAVVSKLVGSYAGARAARCTPHAGMRLAALMNTRGLTEIVVLQTGYSAGILSPALYLSLLIMALITTALSGPLLWTADRLARNSPSPGVQPGLQPAER